MRILLQSAQTKHYFCLLDMWVADPSAAFDFRHSMRAFEFVHQRGLRDVQLLVEFDGPGWGEVVPVPQRVGTLAPTPARNGHPSAHWTSARQNR
jgi:hypothetical protein